MSDLRPVLERFRKELAPEDDPSTALDSLRRLKQHRSIRRRLTAGVVAFAVGLAGIAVALNAFDADTGVVRESTQPAVQPRIITSFPVGPQGDVGAIVAGFGSLWVTASGVEDGGGPDDAALLRIDPAINQVTDVVPLEGVTTWASGGGGVAVGSDAIWVAGYTSGDAHADSQGALYQIDPGSLEAEGTFLGGEVTAADVAVSDDGVWVTGRHEGVATLTHVDPTFGKIDAPEVGLRGETARQVVATDDAVVVQQWGTDGNPAPCGAVTSIDPRTIAPIAEEPHPVGCGGSEVSHVPVSGGLFLWQGHVWTTTSRGFVQLDTSTAKPVGSVVPFTEDGGFPRSAPVVDEHGVWFGAYPGGNGSAPDRLSLLDPVSGSIETFDVEVGWSGAAILDGTLWALGWDGTVTRIDLLEDVPARTEAASLDDCAPDDARVWETVMRPWLTSILMSVGAPEGWDVSGDDVQDTGSALGITVPEYEGRLDVYVHIGVPDLEHDPRGDMAEAGSVAGATLYRSENETGTVQQYLVAASDVWLTLYAYAQPPATTVNWRSPGDAERWLNEAMSVVRGGPPVGCEPQP